MSEAARLGPLHGVIVVDLTRVVSGPFATQMLSDLGARVIKVESPGGGDETRAMGPRVAGESAMFLGLNRGKESVVVDLRSSGGRDVVRDLVRKADIVVENFRPGVAGRLGVGYLALAEINPRAIVCSISGYGQDGPGADRPAYDVIIQALAAGMSLTGEAGRPPVRMGLPIADLSGGLFAVIGILAALHDREITGKGQHVDIALLDCQVSLLSYFASYYLLSGEITRSVGSGHPSAEPYGAFPTKDGHVVIAVYNESFWPKLCAAVGRPEIAADPRFAMNKNRVENRLVLRDILRDAMTQEPTSVWVSRFTDAGVPAAPINSIDQTLADVQVRHRDMVVEMDHPVCGTVRQPGNALKLSRHEGTPRMPPPTLGQHSADVLEDFLHYPPERIAALKREGCVK
jgi:crotonobetainyl-CoA:carnitine CoA-transferase CaiB-like acyl-CoA transferase